MKEIHVECLPDETLVKVLGASRKQITHHSGKSRVFAKLKVSSNQIALVDEDPDSPKCSYEKSLKRLSESSGITEWADNSGNRIYVLRGKLEDWIINLCNAAQIDLKKFNLPDKPNAMHEVINERLSSFEKLLRHLLEQENPGILKLKKALSSN